MLFETLSYFIITTFSDWIITNRFFIWIIRGIWFAFWFSFHFFTQICQYIYCYVCQHLFEDQNKTDEAIKVLTSLIGSENMQNSMDIYRLVISMYKEADRINDAISFLESETKRKQNNSELLYLLGVLYYEADKVNKSLASMERVLENEPDHANALNHYGYTLAEQGIRLDEAEHYIKKALTLEPGSAHIIDSLGWVYFQKGNFGKAIIELQKAHNALPGDPTIAEHLGDAYLKQSDKGNALMYYKKAIEIDPDNQAIKDKVEKLETSAN